MPLKTHELVNKVVYLNVDGRTIGGTEFHVNDIMIVENYHDGEWTLKRAHDGKRLYTFTRSDFSENKNA